MRRTHVPRAPPAQATALALAAGSAIDDPERRAPPSPDPQAPSLRHRQPWHLVAACCHSAPPPSADLRAEHLSAHRQKLLRATAVRRWVSDAPATMGTRTITRSGERHAGSVASRAPTPRSSAPAGEPPPKAPTAAPAWICRRKGKSPAAALLAGRTGFRRPARAAAWREGATVRGGGERAAVARAGATRAWVAVY